MVPARTLTLLAAALLAAACNRLTQAGYVLHPQVRGSHKRIEEVDRAINA